MGSASLPHAIRLVRGFAGTLGLGEPGSWAPHPRLPAATCACQWCLVTDFPRRHGYL